MNVFPPFNSQIVTFFGVEFNFIHYFNWTWCEVYFCVVSFHLTLVFELNRAMGEGRRRRRGDVI